jgi:DNA-binding transcriptional MocR family regulator
MHLAFSTACSRGDTILCEAAIFPGTKAIAGSAGFRLKGVALDREGLEPEALDRAARETAARVLYVTPTLQNPTARIMSAKRRRAVVEIARKRDLLIVEDDVYASYATAVPDIPPLASLAPERSFYLSSASKSIAPGLRAGWLLPPPTGGWRDRILANARALGLALPGFGHALLSRWIEDGTADQICEAVRCEMRLRLDAACSILGSRLEMPPLGTSSLHVFAALAPIEAERCVARAMEQGIALTPPSTVVVEESMISGLRLCLGGAPDIASLTRALHGLAGALSGEAGRLEQTAV